jgi:hypothetical protein
MTRKKAHANTYSVTRYPNKKGSKRKDLITAGYVVGFILLIVIGILSWVTPKNYYLKEIKVAKATVAETAVEYGKYYARVINVDSPGVFLSEDNSWIEVSEDFCNGNRPGKEVGLLIGNYDVFKLKYFGLFGSVGQKFKGSNWAIEEVYDSFDMAVKENPVKKYNAKAVLTKKKATKTGETYFVIDADGRKVNTQVDKEIFDRYNVNDSIECEFEARGDFIKIIRVGI